MVDERKLNISRESDRMSHLHEERIPGLPVRWTPGTPKPLPPERDASGRPFGSRPALIVPVVWGIAGIVAVESMAVLALGIALRMSIFTSPSDTTTTSVITMPSEAPKRSTTAPSDTVTQPSEDVSSDNLMAAASTPSTKVPDSNASPSAPLVAGSALDSIRQLQRILALPHGQSASSTLTAIPATDLELDLFGGEQVLSVGKLWLQPVANSGPQQRSWDVLRSGTLSEGPDGTIGRFDWREGNLSFAWEGGPYPPLRGCLLQVRAKSPTVEAVEVCQLVAPSELPSVRPQFNTALMKVSFAFSEPPRFPAKLWQLEYRIEGVAEAEVAGSPVLRVGETSTIRFPNPDVPDESLFELDISLKVDSEKPVVEVASFAVRPGPTDKGDGMHRIPLSRGDLTGIVKREKSLTVTLEKDLERLEKMLEREESAAAKRTSTTIDKRLQELSVRRDRMERRLEQLNAAEDWAALASMGFQAVEANALIELKFGLLFVTPDGDRTVELARTRGFAGTAP